MQNALVRLKKIISLDFFVFSNIIMSHLLLFLMRECLRVSLLSSCLIIVCVKVLTIYKVTKGSLKKKKIIKEGFIPRIVKCGFFVNQFKGLVIWYRIFLCSTAWRRNYFYL